VLFRSTAGGIEPDVLPHIFDSLASTKSGKTDSKSRCSGLGLALCRDLVVENGGSIRVASTVGVGTTFTITLPAETSASVVGVSDDSSMSTCDTVVMS